MSQQQYPSDQLPPPPPGGPPAAQQQHVDHSYVPHQGAFGQTQLSQPPTSEQNMPPHEYYGSAAGLEDSYPPPPAHDNAPAQGLPAYHPEPPTENLGAPQTTNFAPPPTHTDHQAPPFQQAGIPQSTGAPYDETHLPPPPPRPAGGVVGQPPMLPPRRTVASYDEDDDPSNPIHYTRDPRKLTAYLVPFPKPRIKGVAPDAIPLRFVIYTPPPPPLSKPAEGEKEDRFHKVQRKWQEEVRSAKTSDAKTASWKGVKAHATKGISWAMNQTKTSNLDFLNRIADSQKAPDRPKSPVPPRSPNPAEHDTHTDDGQHEEDTTHKTVGLDEMLLVYPAAMTTTQTPEQIREEFIGTMMRSKSKAQRDAVIATGLLPVSAAIDILATVVWPFGGLLEIDSVWAYSSIRGAKTSRSVTKRLTSTGPASGGEGELKLNFVASPRIEVLRRYLAEACHKRDPALFPSVGVPPSETEVLAAIAWAPTSSGVGEERNWEDEQWERAEVRDDLRLVCSKAAREWGKWCKAFEKEPEKALKK